MLTKARNVWLAANAERRSFRIPSDLVHLFFRGACVREKFPASAGTLKTDDGGPGWAYTGFCFPKIVSHDSPFEIPLCSGIDPPAMVSPVISLKTLGLDRT